MARRQPTGSGAKASLSLLEGLIRLVPLLAVIGIAVSPVGPHIRWEYRYVDGYSPKIYISCTYLGARGRIVPEHLTPECPFLVILDSRDWPKA